MSRESIVTAVAGAFFGLMVGWIIGSQQAVGVRATPPPTQAASTPSAGSGAPAPTLDESRAAQLKATAQQSPTDVPTRVQLANLYFDAERFQDAAEWYEAALTINPRDVNASTDLGIAYYYMNQPDKALAQFDRSLAIDPNHGKTLLNVGIVRAFAKQDLNGASEVWEKVLKVAPDSEEARAARQALDGVRAAHPNVGGGTGK